MDWVDAATYYYLFGGCNAVDQHITLRKDKVLRILGAIKHVLHEAPREGKLLAYSSLCSPILEYEDTVWDLTLAKDIESLEMLQHRVVRFIAGLKGQESVTEACSQLGLQPFKQRRRTHRLNLLMKILQEEEQDWQWHTMKSHEITKISQ